MRVSMACRFDGLRDIPRSHPPGWDTSRSKTYTRSPFFCQVEQNLLPANKTRWLGMTQTTDRQMYFTKTFSSSLKVNFRGNLWTFTFFEKSLAAGLLVRLAVWKGYRKKTELEIRLFWGKIKFEFYVVNRSPLLLLIDGEGNPEGDRGGRAGEKGGGECVGIGKREHRKWEKYGATLI